LSWAQLRADDPRTALQAIDEDYRVARSQDRVQRAMILCDHFPERQEEAFDAAYSWSRFGDYKAITALPACVDYVARRKRKSKSDKGWRWKAKQPARENDLRQAEAELGTKLPGDYRKFLATYGHTELWVRLPEKSGELCFYRSTELATQRSNLFDFISLTEKNPDKVDAYFRQQYGVAARDLVPVAEPAQESHCMVIHLGQGERFGLVLARGP